jgi:hypothetical protein
VDWLNAHLYHLLAARLACVLASTRVTPDMLSAAGALAITLSSFAFRLQTMEAHTKIAPANSNHWSNRPA